MVSDARLTLQATGRAGAYNVPTLNVEGMQGRSLRNVPSMSTEGFQRARSAYSSIQQDARYLREDLYRTSMDILAEQNRDRQRAEDLRNRDLEAQREYVAQLEAGSFAAIQSGLSGNLVALQEQYPENPEVIEQLHLAQVDEQTKNLPPDIEGAIRDIQALNLDPVLEHQRARALQKERVQAEVFLQDAADKSEAVAMDYALPETDRQELAQNANQLLYERLTDARTDLTPAEKELDKLNFKGKVAERSVLDSISRSQTPVMQALRIFQDTSIPIEARQKALTYGMQYDSLLRGIEDRDRAAAREQREAAVFGRIKDILTRMSLDPYDPTIDADLDMMLNDAGNQSEADQILRLQGIINGERTRSVESDPRVVGALDYAIQTGAGTIEEMERTIYEATASNRLNGTDAAQALEKLARRKNSIVSSPTYDLLLSKAKEMLPKAAASSPYNADGSVNFSALLAPKTSDEQLQSSILLEFSNDLSEEVLSGRISDEATLKEYGERKLAEYRNSMQTRRAVSGERTLGDANIDVLPPSEQSAWRRAYGDPVIRELVESRYLKEPELYSRDIQTGTLDSESEEARKIFILLKPFLATKKEAGVGPAE